MGILKKKKKKDEVVSWDELPEDDEPEEEEEEQEEEPQPEPPKKEKPNKITEEQLLDMCEGNIARMSRVLREQHDIFQYIRKIKNK